MIWYIDGVSLEQAGVASISFQFGNQVVDTCTLKLVDTGTPVRQWARDTWVTVSNASGTYFHGQVSSPNAAETAGDSGLDVVISGPMYTLSRIIFARSVTRGGVTRINTSVNLFLDVNRRQQTPVQAMQEMIAWVRLCGGAVAEGVLNPSNMPATPAPKWVEGETCEQVLKNIAGWCPDSAIWWDYSAGIATLNWTAAGARNRHTFSSGLSPMTADTINFDSSMAPDVVIIRYDGAHSEVSAYADYLIDDVHPPGATPLTPGALVLTLGAADWRGVKFASMLYNMGRAFKWGGRISLEGQLVDIKPGDTISISGRPEMAGSLMVVQMVNFTPGNLNYEITAGPPAQLGISDLRDLLWWMRLGAGSSTAVEPELSLTSFQPYLKTLTSPPFGTVVKIAPGYVSFGENIASPQWNGVNLDNPNHPGEPFDYRYFRTFYLKLIWKPDVGVFYGVDALGNSYETYRALSTGNIVGDDGATIVTTRSDNEAPVVNIYSGKVNKNGVYYFPLATVEAVEQEMRVTQHRNMDLNVLFIPPNNLYLMGR